MKKARRHGNFPEKYTIGKDEYTFDTIAGTGEPIYKRKMRDGSVRHVILILEN